MVQFPIDITIRPDRQGADEIRNQLQRIEGIAKNVQRTVLGVFAGRAIINAAQELGRTLDVYNTFANRIRLVTDSQRELNQTYDELFNVARDTRSSLEGTATIYTRLAQSTRDAGIGTQQLLEFTESLNKTIIISGATAREAQGALIQFSQGLALGVLRGDELRSTLEQLPAVADVIARRLGVTRGELLKLGEQGAITRGVILEAFRDAADEIDQSFAQTLPTIGQSLEILQTNFIQVIGTFDRATQVSGVLATVIKFLADNLVVVTAAAGTFAAVLATSLIPAVPVLAGALATLGPAFAAAFPPAAAITGLTLASQELLTVFDDINEALENTSTQATLTRRSDLSEQLQRLEKNADQLRDTIEKSNVASGQGAILLARLEGRISEARQELDKFVNSNKTLSDEQKKLNAEFDIATEKLSEQSRILKLNARERQIQAELLQQIRRLERNGAELDDGERLRLEVQIRENQALRERAEVLDSIVGPEEERIRQTEILNRLLAEGTINQEQFNAALTRLNQIDKPDLSGLGISGELETRLAKLRQQLEDGVISADRFGDAVSRAILRAIGSSDLLSVQIGNLNRLSEEGTITAEEYGQAVDRVLGRSSADQAAVDIANLNTLFENGRLTQDEYARGLDNIRLAGLDASTSLQDGFSRAFIRLSQEANDFASAAEQAVNVFADKATNAILEFTKTGELDFKAFAVSILEEITKIIVRLIVLQTIQAATGIASGGVSTAIGAGVSAGVSAGVGGGSGGSSGGATAAASFISGENGPAIFSGGATAPASTTPAQTAPATIQVVNVSDPDEVPQTINGGKADEAIVNVLTRNKDRIRQVLA